MTKTFKSFNKCTIDEFKNHLEAKEIVSASKARLIPVTKIGDEVTLTSIFLSSMRLVNEFRKEILKNVGMKTSGKIHVFTEVYFHKFDNVNKRPDGLILLETGGKIKDSALIEVKNGRNELKEEQILNYLNIAKEYDIKKLITISNQFVSAPTQSPLQINSRNGVEMYHLSWSYILTIAHILLHKSHDKRDDERIKDEDQIEIMKEVKEYFQNEKSGVMGFTEMKNGWKTVTDKIISDSAIKRDDKDVHEAVVSWLQEERDIALILSRDLNVLVHSGSNKYKHDLSKRIEEESEFLIKNGKLKSVLKIKDNNYDTIISITIDFRARVVTMDNVLDAPANEASKYKTSKGQLGWLHRQIESAKEKNKYKYNNIKDKLFIHVRVKGSRDYEQLEIKKINTAWKKYKDKRIIKFKICFKEEFHGNFTQKRKFVERIENMVRDFYSGLIQHIVPYSDKPPKSTMN